MNLSVVQLSSRANMSLLKQPPPPYPILFTAKRTYSAPDILLSFWFIYLFVVQHFCRAYFS